MVASMEIRGARELQRKLLALEPKIGRKIISASLRAGAKIVQARMKARAPVGRTRTRTRVKGTGAKSVSYGTKQPGYMKRSINVRKATKNRKGTYAVMTGFDTKRFPDLIQKAKSGKSYFIPAAVEYGHKGAPPHPFIRPAFHAVKAHVKRRIMRLMAQGIERVAKQ